MSGDVSMSERRLLFSQSLPALSIYIIFYCFLETLLSCIVWIFQDQIRRHLLKELLGCIYFGY